MTQAGNTGILRTWEQALRALRGRMRPFVIVNPAAAAGRTGRRWPGLETRLRAVLGDADVHQTTGPGDAARLAARAVGEGRTRVVAVGGDGTMSAVVDGLASSGAQPGQVTLALVNAGSSGDFCRFLGLPPGSDASLAALRDGRSRLVDIGRITDLSAAPAAPVHFLNVANAGFSGEVTLAMQRSRLKRLVGARLAYVPVILGLLRRYPGARLRLTLDGAQDLEARVSMLAVANGQYFGAGMWIAPQARVDDGRFDVVLVRQDGRIRQSDLRLIYSGRHLAHPAVEVFRAASLTIRAADGADVLTDADGELVFPLPVRIDCLPGALRLAL
jgi:YegS/Rv2252/BmrU family lipid kinase